MSPWIKAAECGVEWVYIVPTKFRKRHLTKGVFLREGMGIPAAF